MTNSRSMVHTTQPVGENIAMGQNMLLSHSAPVLHPSAVCRPATWGYLLFGRGPGQ